MNDAPKKKRHKHQAVVVHRAGKLVASWCRTCYADLLEATRRKAPGGATR